MSSNDRTTYYLIFDTNVLFQFYEKKSDFTSFSFNATFDNIIDMINQLDIYDQVIVAIPSVVWNEMEKQIIEKHDEQIIQYRANMAKRIFPEFSVSENPIGDYAEYIKGKKAIYKAELSKGLNKIIELPMATSGRFESIINRAFEKHPPFEGKDKKSDKGFKDALLWESILEFALAQPHSKIIYYSKDNAFGEFLLDEFTNFTTESALSICKSEEDVKIQLELWAKEIDKYAYQPIEDFNENKAIVDWLNSGDFLIQVIDKDFDLVEKGRLIVSTSAHLISIDNIEHLSTKDNVSEYLIDIILRFEYNLKDGAMTSETISASATIESFDDAVYSVEDIYRTDDAEAESEE